MKYLVALIICATFIISSTSYAENTKFKQQILPIDCVYEVVNTGTQQLRYITPDTCPVDPGQPVVTEPSASNNMADLGNYNGGGSVAVHLGNLPYVNMAWPQSNSNTNRSDMADVAGGVEEYIKDIIKDSKDDMFIAFATIVFLVATVLYTRVYRKQSHK